MSAKVGCNVGGVYTNNLTYADDVVLLAPSWRALQYLINMLADSATNIDMLCNTDEDCMHGISTQRQTESGDINFSSIQVG